MKVELHPKIGGRESFFIQISEFSFAAYPVQINHVFRCVPEVAKSPNESQNLRRNVLSRRISKLLRWVCGKRTASAAAGNISLEQSVP